MQPGGVLATRSEQSRFDARRPDIVLEDDLDESAAVDMRCVATFCDPRARTRLRVPQASAWEVAVAHLGTIKWFHGSNPRAGAIL